MGLAALLVVAGCASVENNAPPEPRAQSPEANTGSRLPTKR